MWTVMVASTCLAVMASTMVMLTVSESRVVSVHRDQRQVFWLARGTAAGVIRDLQEGQPVPTGLTDTTWGSVLVDQAPMDKDGSEKFSVTARTAVAVDTVHFTWQPATRQVSHWQDNGPPRDS